MVSLIKRDFLITIGTSLILCGFLAMAYAVTLPSIHVMIGVLFVFMINMFYFDNQSNSNRFIVSLPISSKVIVQSRYLYLLLSTFAFILFQWMIGWTLTTFTPMAHYLYQWKDVIALGSIALILLAICIPIYYLFASFTTATVATFVLFFLIIFYSLIPLASALGMDKHVIFNDIDGGLVILIETYIPVWPYVLLTIFAFGFYYISTKVSTALFMRKDQ